MKIKVLAISFLVLICTSCKEDIVPQNCILHEIALDSFNTLEYTTISGGQVYQLKQIFDNGEFSNIVASFQYEYYIDSVIILNLIDPSTKPYLRIKYEDGKLIEATRFFAATGVLLLFEFEYEGLTTRINLTRIASNGDTLLATYAFYHFDEFGNVYRVEQYGIDQEDRSRFVLTKDQLYDYDNNESPFKGLFLPFFAAPDVPSVEFFSSNNVKAIIENNQTEPIRYEYNNFGNVERQVFSDGSFLEFSYLNCVE